MATQTRYPQSNSQGAKSSGVNDWADRTNAYADDASYASWSYAGWSNAYSDIILSGFGFSIPAGSTINSVKLEFEIYKENWLNAGSVNAYLTRSGEIQGAGRSVNPPPDVATAYETTSVGTWSVDQLNETGAAKPTAQIRANSNGYPGNFYLDYVRITVDYTPPATDEVIEGPAAEATFSSPLGSTLSGSVASGPAAAVTMQSPLGVTYAQPEATKHPFALELYKTETGLPICTIHDFASLSYSRTQNEAGRLSVTFPAGHPANVLIRDIYSAEPHGIYGTLYRRGVAWAGVVLAETDTTASPVAWSFLTFEALLREHRTPWNWHGLEKQTLLNAITALAEKGLRWWQVNGASGLAAATLTDCEVKTWAQLSGDSGGFDQSLIILEKHGIVEHYKDSGTAVFAFDFGEQVPLERIRYRASIGEYTSIAVQYRYSADGETWSEWTAEASIADAEYAETYGIAAAGTGRYLEVKFTLRTEDTTTKDQEGDAVGTSPVLFGVEVITSYSTGIDAYSIDVDDVIIADGFDFSHENHLAALASICADYGYAFRIDHLKRLYVWTPGSSSPVVLKKGETCEPQVISYRGLDSIENSLTCYGAGEGLGRLSTIAEDSDSILIYGRRPGVFEDAKIGALAALQSAGAAELLLRAWPILECQIKAPYEPGRGVLDTKVHDLVKYIDPEAWTGSDELGSHTFEITSEQREWTPGGENVTLGLNSDLDTYFVKQVKKQTKSNKYRHGRAAGQVPFDVRAVGGFAQIQLYWHGSAPEYIVEVSANGTDGWASIARTADRAYLHGQLASATTYYYRVRAVYKGAISGPSVTVSATTTSITAGDFDTTAPAVPTGLAASTDTIQTTAGTIVIMNLLEWDANTETDLSFYELRRSVDESAWIIVGVIPAGQESFVDTQGLVEGETYYYQIRAVDKTGNRSDWSASDSIETAADADAPSIEATAPTVQVGKKLLAVIMPGTAAKDLAYYELQRAEADATLVDGVYEVPASPSWSDFATITGSAIRGLKYVDTDVAYSKCYKYKYRAVDASGNASSWSNESSAAVPSQTLATDIAVNSITADRYHELRNTFSHVFGPMSMAGSKDYWEFWVWLPANITSIASAKLMLRYEKFTGTPPTSFTLFVDEGAGYDEGTAVAGAANIAGWQVVEAGLEIPITGGGAKLLKLGWSGSWTANIVIGIMVEADLTA